jgi:hypothetical protein
VVKKLLFGVLALTLLAAVFVVVRMGPRNVIGMIRYDQRRKGALRVGDRAPDLALLQLDGTSAAPLSRNWSGRPCVLVFGSFT